MKRLYAALTVLCGIFSVLWVYGESRNNAWLTDLMPNAMTETAFLLLVVVIIERLLRSEDDKRREREERPLAALAFRDIGRDLKDFAWIAALDYAITHDKSFEPIPAGVVEILDQWSDGLDTRDMATGEAWIPSKADAFTARLTTVLSSYGRVLSPALYAELLECKTSVEKRLTLHETVMGFGANAAAAGDINDSTSKTIVSAFRALAVCFADISDEGLQLESDPHSVVMSLHESHVAGARAAASQGAAEPGPTRPQS